MKYKTLFLSFLLLFLASLTSATSTVGTNTKLIDASNIDFFLSGTKTGTTTIPDMPQVMSISITPQNVTMNAGDSIQFMADAIYDTGKIISLKEGFSCNQGKITTTGIFTPSLAGRAVVSIGLNGFVSQTEVAVRPATLHHITITPPVSLIYGKKYPIEGLFPYQVFDKYDNEVIVDKTIVKSTIKKNTTGNLLGRLIGAGGSATNSPYIAMLKPVLIGGYVSEAGQILFFERGSYTVAAKYGDITDTKEFIVKLDEPYADIEAWEDYHMGQLDLDNRWVSIQFDINGGINKVIPLRGDVYDRFYDNGLMCKFYAICYGHYEILQMRQEMLEMNSKKAINKAFMSLIAPQGGK